MGLQYPRNSFSHLEEKEAETRSEAVKSTLLCAQAQVSWGLAYSKCSINAGLNKTGCHGFLLFFFSPGPNEGLVGKETDKKQPARANLT